MSLSKQILLALLLGIALGLFFGEKIAFLSIGGRAFVQLLQITVLPYVAGSLIYGFGSLGGKEARLVFTRGGCVAARDSDHDPRPRVPVAAGPPLRQGRCLLQRRAPRGRAAHRLGEPLHPLEPFYALANNVVPAVVVFAILAGAALMGMKDKDTLLRPIAVFNEAMGRVGTMVSKATPYGIFAIAAHTAATMRLEEFERLQGFLLPLRRLRVPAHVLAASRASWRPSPTCRTGG